MKDKYRAIISVALFAAVFWGSPYLLGSGAYNITARAIELLAGVVAGGCYWIGSRK